ncbi:hypothetical protein Patl1_02041 [Pistacia atlantica]|uniref:Uncharacterized protein n=1 Tax=Pistacia atlantica TaxID=434234 RepID=A0ACC1C5Z1_9ROSI|nr:hypothetical protein Patl1_02041 [Pistacia atlantica]
MSETRPVPRRESPWGTPEGEHRQPKAHRCNDRAEDVIQACFEGNPFKTIPGPFKLFWRCMRSKPWRGTNRTIHLFATGSPKERGGET